MVFVYLGDIWLVFVCYLGGICVWVVWLSSVWLHRRASIPLFKQKMNPLLFRLLGFFKEEKVKTPSKNGHFEEKAV